MQRTQEAPTRPILDSKDRANCIASITTVNPQNYGILYDRDRAMGPKISRTTVRPARTGIQLGIRALTLDRHQELQAARD